MASTVYVLTFVTTGPEGEHETTLLGVYSTQSEAEAASDRAIGVPQFAAFPEGLEIDPFVIDRDSW